MMCMDWLVDVFNGKIKAGHDKKMFLRTNGSGPNSKQGENKDAFTGGVDILYDAIKRAV